MAKKFTYDNKDINLINKKSHIEDEVVIEFDEDFRKKKFFERESGSR
jgi:hypothetical protein